MIKEWIDSYNPKNKEEILSALREIMQEVAIAGLSRTDFFEKAAFYGGTALRIFYGLDRFSEDLDFSLLKPEPEFTFQPYFSALVEEYESLGIHVTIREKVKSKETLCQEIILEDLIKQTGVRFNRTIKIKLEVNRNPPLHFSTEEKLLVRPFSFYVKCFSQSSLFAGKMHALLYHKWKSRVKGRDWYDLEWYIKNGIALDVQHFCQRANESGDWKKKTITAEQIKVILRAKIAEVSFDNIREDVVRFVKDDRGLDIWSPTYFNDLIEKMKFE